jgi:hypothetical protein
VVAEYKGMTVYHLQLLEMQALVLPESVQAIREHWIQGPMVLLRDQDQH